MVLLKLAEERYAIKWDDGDHSFVSRRDIDFKADGTTLVKHYGGKCTFVFDSEGRYPDEYYGDKPVEAQSQEVS